MLAMTRFQGAEVSSTCPLVAGTRAEVHGSGPNQALPGYAPACPSCLRSLNQRQIPDNAHKSTMNGRQFIYHMQGLTKIYPGNRKVLEDIHLSFYPDAKIGVLGVNGSGKSTLLRIMAGIDTEFIGEA